MRERIEHCSRLRRPGQLVAVTCAIGLVLAGCGSGDTDSDDGQAASATTEASGGTPSSGGELNVVMSAEPTVLNPLEGPVSPEVDGTIIERYLEFDDDGELSERSLVGSFERLDPTTWRFTMRPEVEFSNGEPADASAAAWAVMTHHERAGLGVVAREFELIETAVAVDDTVFEVTTTEAVNLVPQLFNSLYALPPAYFEEIGSEEFGRAPIGTGPFELDVWESGTAIRLARNDGYWRGRPHLDGIRFSFAGDASTRVNLLTTGAADLVLGVPVELRDEVEATDGAGLSTVETQLEMLVVLNQQAGPLTDDRLREAAALAIDRDQIVDAIMGGDGQGGAPSGSLLGDRFDLGTEMLEPDPERARELVGEVDGSTEVSLSYTANRYFADTEIGEAVAGMLENAGFSVKRNPLEAPAFFDAAFSQQLDGAFLFAARPPYPHEAILASGFLTGEGAFRTCGDPRFTELAADGLAADDDAERKATYREMEEIAIHELHCFVPLFNYVAATGVADTVQGFDQSTSREFDYFPVSISEQ